MTKTQDYRLRIVAGQAPQRPSISYIIRQGGRVSYMSGSETPLALSNLIHDDAAAVRFALEDAKDGAAAAGHLRIALGAQWQNNPALCPKVEVL